MAGLSKTSFEDLAKKAGGLTITAAQKADLLRELKGEIAAKRKEMQENKDLPKEVFAALDAEYGEFAKVLGEKAASRVSEAIQGHLGTDTYKALFEGDPSAITGFGEAKTKVDTMSRELLTDVRDFHNALVAKDGKAASAKLDDILDSRESLALMDASKRVMAAYGTNNEITSNFSAQLVAMRNLDTLLQKQYMGLKGDTTISAMFKARDLAKSYSEAATAIQERLDRSRNTNDDLNVNLGDISLPDDTLAKYDEILGKYEDMVTEADLKALYMKEPALASAESVENVDFGRVKEDIMQEIFATVQLDADDATVKKNVDINAAKAAKRLAKELVDQFKATGQFIAGVVVVDPNLAIEAAERKQKAAEKKEAETRGRLKKTEAKLLDEQKSTLRMTEVAKEAVEARALSDAEIERIDAELDRYSVQHAEVGNIATRFDDAQETVEKLRDLRVAHSNDDYRGTNKFTREEKDRVLAEYEAAVKGRFDAMEALSAWKRRNNIE